MKRLTAISALVAFIVVALFSVLSQTLWASSIDDNLALKSMWKEYDSAAGQDRPQKQLSILNDIVEKSKGQNLPFDYYEAARRRAQVRANINWKDRANANTQFADAVKEYDLPVMTYYYLYQNKSRTEAFDYAKEHAAELRKSNVVAFRSEFSGDSGLHAYVGTLVRNDYEYALWSLSMYTSIGRELLASEVAGRYPDEAIVEYLTVADKYGDTRKAALKAHAEKYAGKAASMLSRQRLLMDEFSDLEGSEKATEQQFKDLRERCASYEKERKSFSGDENRLAQCCTEVVDLISTLDSHSSNVRINDGELVVIMRNLDKVKVEIKSEDGKTSVYKNTIENPAKRYYVMDTVKTMLPAFSDGDYVLVYNGNSVDQEENFSKTTLSVATRQDSKGYSFYVADYMTGKPVDKVDVALYIKDKEIASVKAVQMNGFVPVPEALTSKIGKNYAYIRCSYTDADGIYHRSGMVNVEKDGYVKAEPREQTLGSLFFDRRAFNPGETISFKGVFYTLKGVNSKVLPKGREVVVVMYDAQGNECGTSNLKTNDFGSVAGSFAIPEGKRNGMFSMRASVGGEILCYESFRVDEFVLPTFNVEFESIDKLLLVGDKVVVKGYAKSYSGHSLSSAKVFAEINRNWNEDGSESVLSVASDGSFEIVVDNAKEGSYRISVKVVDSTGETLEFSTSFYVYDRVPLSMSLKNTSEASQPNVVADDFASVSFDVEGTKSALNGPVKIIYKVMSGAKTVSVGSAEAMSQVDIDIKALASGTYTIEAEATAVKSDGSSVSGKTYLSFTKMTDKDTVFDADMESLFRVVEGEDIALQFAAGRGPVWACVEIFGTGNVLLRSEMVYLEGARGKEGSIKMLTYGYSKDWSDVVTLKVFYFKNGQSNLYTHEYRRAAKPEKLVLSVERCQDEMLPSSKYTVTLSGTPQSEIVASVFDKSTETIESNYWYAVSQGVEGAPNVYYIRDCGSYSAGNYWYRPMKTALFSSARATKAVAVNNFMVADDAMVVEECAVMEEGMSAYSGAGEESVAVRENFANTLAFEPFVNVDASGKASFSFSTSDKLSTYVLNLFEHDKTMRSAVARQEFKVTLPVKVAVVEPQLLYVGDHYVVKANISSTAASKVNGRIAVYLYGTEAYKTAKPVASTSKNVSVAPGESETVDLGVDVPDVNVLGIKVVFTGVHEGTSISDAVFVKVGVRRPFQTIREAHSAVLLSGQDKNALVEQLRSQFVNVDGSKADEKVITILDMVKEAVPQKIEPAGKDVLSLTESLYAMALAESLGMPATPKDSILAEVLGCRNSDGGFAWFDGMKSSPMVTAVILQRAGSLKVRGLDLGIADDILESAVAYLDKAQFNDSNRPYWCGGISLESYLYIRAMYPSVALAAKPNRDARKDIKSYLVPKKARGLNGAILSKARRLRTLQLLSADDASKLASAIGVSSSKKLAKSLEADKESLKEYAVEHVSGGMYFPNAVMPWRGLMENELYAHSLLCDLFSANGEEKLADGIRIWLMIQKETQKWGDDPAFIEAIASVLDGSDAVLETSVVVLSAEKEMPFQDIKKAGNGFTVTLSYYREDGSEIKPGDKLSVGDKITSSCKIWSEENRSFVKLIVPRPASFRPVSQLSGNIGWWTRPISVVGWVLYSPQGYKNVKAGETEYYYDSFPEETTTITESLYVTQAGEFVAPVVSVESLYAPHYVACDGFAGRMLSE